MTIPNLPTDSLYKYMAIGGIAIAIFSAYFLNDISSKKMESKRVLIKEIELLQYEFKHEEDPEKLKELGRKMIEKRNDVEGLQDLIRYNKGFRCGSMAFIALGLTLSAAGFLLWYTKLQKHQDMVVRDDANRYVNERSTRIHQVQFEKEFNVYNELWGTLFDLKEALVGAHLRFSLARNKDDFETEKAILQRDFDTLLGRCNSVYQKNEPFYSPDVYRLVNEFTKSMLVEGASLFLDKRDLNEGLAAVKEAEVKIDKICHAIRERIGMIERV